MKKVYTKNIIALMAIVMMSLVIFESVDAKKNKTIPSVKVKDMKGKLVNTAKFNNDGKPFVISFWATWCKPCLMELNNISEVYDDWVDETGVKLIAISIDDSRNSRKVPPLVKSRGWEFEVYVDANSDFKRAMNVVNPPHTFLLNGKGEIVYEHNGYAPGDEKKLYKKIKKLLKK